MDQSLLPLNCDAYCKSDVMESEKFTFVWEVSKFSTRTKGTNLFSKEFTIQGPGSKSTKWCGKIRPNGADSEYENCISVFLENRNDEDISIRGAVKLMSIDLEK